MTTALAEAPARATLTIGGKVAVIFLNRQLYALVDAIDLPLISDVRWTAVGAGDRFYAVRKSLNRQTGKRTWVGMHRVVCPSDWPATDHINHNTLDNRRANLRPCTDSQNVMNGRKSPGKSSRFKGVSWCGPRGKWQVHVRGRMVGYFLDETEAARAYDRRAAAEFGQFAHTNFPRKELAQ